MTVKELRRILEGCDGNDVVVMSKDGEGNAFSPIDAVSQCSYVADSTWSGQTGIRELTPELESLGWSEDDVIGGVAAVCFWPTN